MIKEKDQDNGLRIFCIFFQNKVKGFIKEVKGDSKFILNQIANLGETKQYYNSDSLSSLFNIFSRISNTIQNNYRLEIEEKKYRFQYS